MLEIDQFEITFKILRRFYKTNNSISSVELSSTLYTLQEEHSFLTGPEIMVVYEKNS